jgi:quercetin dioxygenase-like cupin family protein
LKAATISTLSAAAFAAMATLGTGAQADGAIQYLTKSHDSVVAPGAEWKPAASIPPGARMVMLYGDPSKAGPYVFRVHFPAGYRLPPHRHEDQRWVTVLKGNYWSAAGEVFDQSQLKKFGPRDAYTTDAGVTHFAWAETEVVIQEMGIGPTASPIEYANPADDPRRQ